MKINTTNTYDYQSVLFNKLVASNKTTEVKSTQDMTMEEYKAYIDDKISKIPFHISHRKIKEYLTISDEGYRAMKEDPEYEKWVLNHIRENRSVDMSFMTNNPSYLSGEDYEFIGGTKESCHGEGYNNWDNRIKKKCQDKEAERKRQREKQIRKARKKALDKQYFLKQEGIRDLYKRIANKRREYSRYLNESSLKKEKAERPKSINVTAIRSYESSFVMDMIREMDKIGNV